MIELLKEYGLITDVDVSNIQALMTFARLESLGDAPSSVGVRYERGDAYSRAFELYAIASDWHLNLGGERQFAVAGFSVPVIGDSVRQVEVIEAAADENCPVTGLNQVHIVTSPAAVEEISAQRGLTVTRRGSRGHLSFVTIPVNERLHVKVRDHQVSALLADSIIQRSLGLD